MKLIKVKAFRTQAEYDSDDGIILDIPFSKTKKRGTASIYTIKPTPMARIILRSYIAWSVVNDLSFNDFK